MPLKIKVSGRGIVSRSSKPKADISVKETGLGEKYEDINVKITRPQIFSLLGDERDYRPKTKLYKKDLIDLLVGDKDLEKKYKSPLKVGQIVKRRTPEEIERDNEKKQERKELRLMKKEEKEMKKKEKEMKKPKKEESKKPSTSKAKKTGRFIEPPTPKINNYEMFSLEIGKDKINKKKQKKVEYFGLDDSAYLYYGNDKMAIFEYILFEGDDKSHGYNKYYIDVEKLLDKGYLSVLIEKYGKNWKKKIQLRDVVKTIIETNIEERPIPIKDVPYNERDKIDTRINKKIPLVELKDKVGINDITFEKDGKIIKEGNVYPKALSLF